MILPPHTIIGHRGLCHYAPENTLPSFQAAVEKGLSWVEFDIQLTQDNQLIVIHDDTLDRTTNATGAVRANTADTCLSADAGGWFEQQFENTPVPTLEAVLSYLWSENVHCNIELKANPADKADLIHALTPILQGWPKAVRPPLISSFSHDLLPAVRAIAPACPLGYLMEKCQPKRLRQLNPKDRLTIHCSAAHNTPESLSLVTAQGYETLVYTVNDPVAAQRWFKAGIRGIFSDKLYELT